MGIKDYRDILREMGISWIIYRVIYSMKLALLRAMPFFESVFEDEIEIKRYNLFDFNGQIEEELYRKSPEDKAAIIRIADNVIQGKILAFSSHEFDYGKPINWMYNPLSGRLYDANEKWFCIPDFDEKMGDIKATWELNRFTHVWYLSRAYIITRDKKYYLAFKNQVEGWIKQNRYGYGPNYKCGQECALRVINILIAASVFSTYNLLDDNMEACVRRFIDLNYKKIRSNFFYAQKCIKIDHYISELCGQIAGAWCAENEDKVIEYFSLLDEQIIEQFNDSGLFESYSLNYQRYVLQLMEFMISIATKCGYDFSVHAKDLLIKSANTLLEVSNDDGHVPNFGANDGTLLFPIEGYENYRSTAVGILRLLAYGHSLCGGKYIEEGMWFANKKNCGKISIDHIKKNPAFLTLKNKGLVVYMNAHKYKTRPGQMDQLHIDIWIDGKNVFCDSGSYSYTSGIGDTLSSTYGHNTVIVGKKEQMKRKGRFMVYGKPTLVKQESTIERIFCKMSYVTGYAHERGIKRIENGVEITDVVSSKEEEPLKIVFHTPYKVIKVDDKTCRISFDISKTLTLKSSAGKLNICKNNVSKTYLDLHEVYVIEVMSHTNVNNNVVSIKME